MSDIYTKLQSYGVQFEGEQGSYIATEEAMTLHQLVKDNGGRVVRVRWIGGEFIPGRGKCYDLSYAHGVTADGRRVSLRLDGLDNWSLVARRSIKGEMIAWAKAQGVFAKGCGLLDDGNYSFLG